MTSQSASQKAEVVYQLAAGKSYKEPTITVKGQRLQVVDKFVHLPWKHIVKIRAHRCTLMMKWMPGFPKLVQHLADYVVVFGTEMESGLTQSWKSTKLWCQHNCMHAKSGQFTNGMSKEWTTSIQAALEFFLKIKRQDKIPDTEVLKRSGMQSVHTPLKLAQLRWTGHVTRMHEERLPKKILHGELELGKRSKEGRKKRYKDTLKASLKDFNIPTESWEQIAQDRAQWQGLIRLDASEYEAKIISEAEQKRAQRKARAKASPTKLSCSDLCCSICNRPVRARIGLISHLRTHKQ